MIGDRTRPGHTTKSCGGNVIEERSHRLRLVIVMADGPAGAVPEAWRAHAHIDDARASAREALRHPKVLRVAIVEDGCELIGAANPLHLVEWHS